MDYWAIQLKTATWWGAQYSYAPAFYDFGEPLLPPIPYGRVTYEFAVRVIALEAMGLD